MTFFNNTYCYLIFKIIINFITFIERQPIYWFMFNQLLKYVLDHVFFKMFQCYFNKERKIEFINYYLINTQYVV